MKTKRFTPMITVLALGAAACAEVGRDPAGVDLAPAFSSGVSGSGVTPTFWAGNIAGEGAAVCAVVNPGTEPWLGFKIDPPVSGTTAGISYTLSGGSNEFLSWSSGAGVIVHAVVVKGGPNTNVYYYNPPARTADTNLHSPPVGQGNTPAVSHFVFCYTLVEKDEGCTPGFWKNRALTTGDWAVAGYDPAQALSSVFTFGGPNAAVNALGATSMYDALSFPGGSGPVGGARILLRAAAAAVLNAAHPDVSYALSTAQVITQVNAALVKGTDSDNAWRARMLALAATLDAHNNEGCPLGAAKSD